MAMSDTSPKRMKSEPNIVPFTDILLVLLVIFMVATPFLHNPVNVDLPEAAHPTILPGSDQSITVHLAEDGRVFVNHVLIKDVTKITTAIEDQLRRAGDKKKVVLRVDDAVEYGMVVDLMHEIKNAQIEEVSLLAKNVASANLP
jgi:biopolymer transport protein TolR